jgi:cholest-4-en-3-one 26-monooxygenase
MTMHDVDLMDPKAFLAGVPHDYFRALRQYGGLPQGKDAEGNAFWYAVRYHDVASISRDTTRFSSSPTTMTSFREVSSGFPIITFLDPPAHTRLRKLIFKVFTPGRLAALERPIRDIADSLLATARAKGKFDLAEDIALRLPFEVLVELLGIPESNREEVIRWARQTLNLGDPEFDEDSRDVFRLVFDYFQDLSRLRAAEPADDLFSALAAVRLKDDRLTLDEIGTFATTLITVGSETTYCSITGAVLALLEHPDQLALLRADRSLIRPAVDEILRWVTPVTHFARNVVADVEIAGQQVKAGDRIVMWYSSANRDESVFTDPDRFDITRHPNPHLAFGGGGPHVCIGNGLAMLELRLFLEAVLDLLPDMELTGSLVRAETNFMNTIKHMPVRLR